MINDRRPYYLKRLQNRLQDRYVRHFIQPQLTELGVGFHFIRPWKVELFGSPIKIGDYAHIICAKDKNVKIVIWPGKQDSGSISIGDCCLLSPGVRINSAHEVKIGNNCMLANEAYITDADWHGVYDRLQSPAVTAPVVLKENVWIGDSAIVCKGVTIGENSIVGAGAVVNKSIPPNVIAAGNPARIVKKLDPDKELVKREKLFQNFDKLTVYMNEFDRTFLKENTTATWLRSILFPKAGD